MRNGKGIATLLGTLAMGMGLVSCGPPANVVYARGMLDGTNPVPVGSFQNLLAGEKGVSRQAMPGGSISWSDFQGVNQATCSYAGKESVSSIHEGTTSKDTWLHSQYVPLCTGDDFASSKYVFEVLTVYHLLTGNVYGQYFHVDTMDGHNIWLMEVNRASALGIKTKTAAMEIGEYGFKIPLVTKVEFGDNMSVKAGEQTILTIGAGSSIVFVE